MSQKSSRPTQSAKNESGEYATFETALEKVLSVPHSALKAQLDPEKRVRKQRGNGLPAALPAQRIRRPFLPPCQSPPQRLTASPRSAIRPTRNRSASFKLVSVCVLAIVEPECLLIHVSEQMKRLDRNVGSIQSALQQRPEVFDPVVWTFPFTYPSRWLTNL